MTQVQIIGIAVASLVVLLLVIALIVTRRRHAAGEEQPQQPEEDGSFLDSAPQDTLSQLGRPEQPVEDVTVDPAVARAEAAKAARAPAGPADALGPAAPPPASEPPPAPAPPFTPPVTPAPVERAPEPGETTEGGLSLVWGTNHPAAGAPAETTAEEEGSVQEAAAHAEAESPAQAEKAEARPEARPLQATEAEGGPKAPPAPAGESAAGAQRAPAPPEPELETAPPPEPLELVPAEESGDLDAQVTGEMPALEDVTIQMPAVGGAPAGPPAQAAPLEEEVTGETESHGRKMPLSDIIVTTSNKVVDLDDPEVRRMLADLVTFEIDQAEEFRRQGMTIDAILQLTEAEKVSRALGMTESAERIRTMMKEIQSRG